MDLSKKEPLELLKLYSDILKELKSKQIIRTYNAPLADYAEWLVQDRLNLK